LILDSFQKMGQTRSVPTTAARVAVLSALRDHPHADVSHQGVCDLLHARTAATPMRRFQPTGHEARLGDNRHRVVGRSCGAIADVDRAVGYTACMPAADDLSHQIDEAEVIYGPSGG
jgi:Fur family transcriptional regulator, stress-responsive regulator